MPRIELVFDPECPHVGAARAALAAALRDAGLPERWTEWNRRDPDAPQRVAGLGSPTILVDGRDVCDGENGVAAGSSCRVYAHGAGPGTRLSGVPPRDAIVSALRAAAGAGEPAPPGAAATQADATRGATGAAEPGPPPGRLRGALLGAAAVTGGGASLASLGASACCLGAAVASASAAVLGASGAAALTGFEPYSPYLLGGAGLVLAAGLRAAYRAAPACEPRAATRAARWKTPALRGALWGAAGVWLLTVVLKLAAAS